MVVAFFKSHHEHLVSVRLKKHQINFDVMQKIDKNRLYGKNLSFREIKRIICSLMVKNSLNFIKIIEVSARF